MSASFEEKSVWIQLLGMIGILGSYLIVAGMMLLNGITTLMAFLPLFLISVAALVVVLMSGHIIAAIAGKADGPDERDRLIGWRADSNSSWVLAAGTFTGITGLVLSIAPVWIAHLLLLSMFLSELTKLTFQLIYYRRGV